MALKDWKKQRKDYWIKKTGKYWKHLEITKNTVWIWSKHPIDRKEFKTKTQALKFAKSYMIKH